MPRVLTIAREYASGGALIARVAAGRLGWRLLDRNFVEEAAAAAKVDPELARRFDERADTWLHRVSRAALWRGAFEAVAPLDDLSFFDAETMTALARSIIADAHQQGSCVIVGRGAQCVLQEHPDVFHVFVYAPMRERVARLRERMPEVAGPEAYIRSREAERVAYIQSNYGCVRTDPHLYQMMLCSSIGIEAAAGLIVSAMQLHPAGTGA